VHLDWEEPSKVVRLVVDQDRARAMGITTSDLSTALQASLSGTSLLCPWDSPGKNTGVGLPFPSPGDLSGFPAFQVDSLPSKVPGKPQNFHQWECGKMVFSENI